MLPYIQPVHPPDIRPTQRSSKSTLCPICCRSRECDAIKTDSSILYVIKRAMGCCDDAAERFYRLALWVRQCRGCQFFCTVSSLFTTLHRDTHSLTGLLTYRNVKGSSRYCNFMSHTQIKVTVLNIAGKYWKRNVSKCCLSSMVGQLKMAAVFFKCTWSIFWALESKPFVG